MRNNRGNAVQRLILFLLSVIVLLAVTVGVGAEGLHPDRYAGKVVSRTGDEVDLRKEPGVEFGREEELWVYRKTDEKQVMGQTLEVTWETIGRIRLDSFDGTSAKASIANEYAGFSISVGDEVGRLPNTPPTITYPPNGLLKVKPGHEISIVVKARDDEKDVIYYSTEVNGGTLLSLGEQSPIVRWVAPSSPGTYEMTIRVGDGRGAGPERKLKLEVQSVHQEDPYRFVYAVGGNSRAPWQFGEVTDIKMDENGNMRVLDAKAKVIHTIGPTGVEREAIDLTQGKSGNSITPSRISVDKEGGFHVLDIPHKTLDTLDQNGNFLPRIFENSDRKDFLLEAPSDVTSAEDGAVLVTDSMGGHVVKIDRNGRFVALFVPQGDGLGQLLNPMSITTNRYGDIFVLDPGNDKILEFDRTFKYRTSYTCVVEGEEGEILANFRGDTVFVLDCQTGTVRELGSDGRLKKLPNMPEVSVGATSMAVTQDGGILIGTPNASILEFSPSGRFQGILGAEDFSNVTDIAVKDDGTLFVIDNKDKEIEVYDRHRWLRKRFGGKGKLDGQFQNPFRIGIDGEGNFYAFDNKRYCIQKFKADTTVDKEVPAGKGVARDLRDAVDMDIKKSDGSVYILDKNYASDREKKAVYSVQQDGSLETIPLNVFGSQLKKQTKAPTHLAVDNEGNIFVAYKSKSIVVRFDSKGEYTRTLGGKGKEKGKFGRIVDIATDGDGNVYVLLNDRRVVSNFDRDGNFVMEVPLEVNKDISLRDPERLAVDSLGSIYVYDDYFKAVFKFMQ